MGDTATAAKHSTEPAKATAARPVHRRAAQAQRKAASIERKLNTATDTLATLQKQFTDQAELVLALVRDLGAAEQDYRTVFQEEC
eukprot:5360713-Pyramimonas_sp.AAC.1